MLYLGLKERFINTTNRKGKMILSGYSTVWIVGVQLDKGSLVF